MVGSFYIGQNFFTVPDIQPGLYLVSTPIGNLSDISIRALETLASVDLIACEDTRVTRILLNRYAIQKKTTSYYHHNTQKSGEKLLNFLRLGKAVALVSDAGTPLISDPGFDLVQKTRAEGIRIIPIPGASSVLAALVASGFSTEQFLFVGFLSSKHSQKLKKLETLKDFQSTLVFFEAPHRLYKTLNDMLTIFGSKRRVALCRELTKIFETIEQHTLETLIQKIEETPKIRGEFVIVVEPSLKKISKSFSIEEIDELLIEHSKTQSAASAASDVAKITGEKKSHLYKRLVFQERQTTVASKNLKHKCQ